MLLGDLLSRFEDEATAAEALIGLGDLGLLAAVRAAVAAESVPLGAYAASAVRRYAAEASDEEWTTLIGAMARTDNPGALCLTRALRYALLDR